MLELTRLKVFREVASLGSFTKAAETLGFAQPSISHHVAQLERELGTQLLIAAGMGVALLPRLAVAMSRRPGVAVLALSDLAIERVTFIAARSGAYRSPLTDAFRAALRQAVAGVSDPVLPLETFEPHQAVAAR